MHLTDENVLSSEVHLTSRLYGIYITVEGTYRLMKKITYVHNKNFSVFVHKLGEHSHFFVQNFTYHIKYFGGN